MYFSNSNEVLPKIIEQIDKALNEGANPYAAFDADGTLWAMDAGDVFYQYLIDNKCVDLPEDPWGFYLNMKATDPKKGYLWLAQIFKGKNINQVKEWANEAFKKREPIPTFEEQKKIIDHLHKKNVKVYIVTASIKWAVEPYAHLYNIPSENVIGVETKIKNDTVTDIQKGPITYRSGKVDGFLHKADQAPFYVAGNTFGDLDLLKSSSHIRVAIQSAKENEEIFNSEMELFNEASKQSWFCFR